MFPKKSKSKREIKSLRNQNEKTKDWNKRMSNSHSKRETWLGKKLERMWVLMSKHTHLFVLLDPWMILIILKNKSLFQAQPSYKPKSH